MINLKYIIPTLEVLKMNETQGMRDQVHECFLDITGAKPSEEKS